MHSDLRQVLTNDEAMRHTLRRLPRHTAPGGMTSRLRAVAVQDRVHKQQQPAWRRVWKEVYGHAHLAFQNFMRPLAVPALGGVFSAVTLFNLWVVPAYPVQHKSGSDVSTQLMTDARIMNSYAIDSPGTFAVDVLVDDRGRVVDYSIIAENYVPSEAVLRNLQNFLAVYSEFRPATTFGKPKASMIRLQFSSIEVKG